MASVARVQHEIARKKKKGGKGDSRETKVLVKACSSIFERK